MNDMVPVNQVYLIIIFFNRPQFLVDSNEIEDEIITVFVVSLKGHYGDK